MFPQVLAQASNPELFVSVTDAITAVESATVQAFASANINACVNGVGQVEAMASQLAQAIVTVSAEVSAVVVASVTPESAVAMVDVTASGDTVVVTTIESTATVESSGAGGKLMFIHA